MIGVCIPCSIHEDWRFVKTAYRRLRELGFSRYTVYATEDCSVLRGHGVDTYCVETEIGVGRAREVLADIIEDIVKDVTWIMYMDAHVYLSNSIRRVIERVTAAPRRVAVVVPRVALWSHDGSLDDSRWADGSYFTYYTLRWQYIYNFSGQETRILGSNEPIYFVHIDFLKMLRDLRGFMYLPYWGFEIYDITVSAWRLGYEVINTPIVAGYHLWRPSFPKGRLEDEERWRSEPWYSYARQCGWNPFTFSIELNKYMYILAHYPEHHLEAALKNVNSIVKSCKLLPIEKTTLRSFARVGKDLESVYKMFSGMYSRLWV